MTFKQPLARYNKDKEPVSETDMSKKENFEPRVEETIRDHSGTQLPKNGDTDLREQLSHVYGECFCDWKNMHCFYWRSNDPDFIETLPKRQLDEVMKIVEARDTKMLEQVQDKLIDRLVELKNGDSVVEWDDIAEVLSERRQYEHTSR